jgi:hypothetical protein
MKHRPIALTVRPAARKSGYPKDVDGRDRANRRSNFAESTHKMIPLTWSNWIPLDADLPAYQVHIASVPGFYRVRASGSDCLAYIGQTGRSLRQRTRAELAKHVMRPAALLRGCSAIYASPRVWIQHAGQSRSKTSVVVTSV